MVVCSPRATYGHAGVSRMVEGVEGETQVVTVSREMAGVHGDAEVKLSGLSMAEPPLVDSEQEMAWGWLDLGCRSISSQEKRGEGKRDAGESM